MSYTIHKTYGVNKKTGLQGFQFNYPFDGAIFDKTRQAYLVVGGKGIHDETLKNWFISEMQYNRNAYEDKWQDIGKLLKAKTL